MVNFWCNWNSWTSNLYNEVIVCYTYFSLMEIQCKNEAQVERSHREYNATGRGCSSSATQWKYIPQGMWDGEGEFAVPVLIYNTMCILWATNGLFEGNFSYSQSILDQNFLARFGILKCVPDTRLGSRQLPRRHISVAARELSTV